MSHFAENWGNFHVPNNVLGYSTISPHSHQSTYTGIPKAIPISHTQSPIVTGTSVLGLIYKDGVMLAADCLASYGSLARFRDQRRLTPVGIHTIIGTSGDISDLQYMQSLMQELQIEEYVNDDKSVLTPWQYYNALAGYMYRRRSKNDPLWNAHVVGGVQNGRKFLGYVDLLGTRYQSSTIATGFGAYLAQPILRKEVEGRENALTFEEAKIILENCMRVLFYRDARSLNKIIMANITDSGSLISNPYVIDSDWTVAEYVRGYQ